MTARTLVVDLCGTIVMVNTTHGFLISEVMPFWRRLLAHGMLSRVGAVVIRKIFRRDQRAILIWLLRGLNRDRLKIMARKYATVTLNCMTRQDVVDAIAKRRASGAKVYLASASLDIVVEAFANHLQADGFIATELEFRGGVCSGRIVVDSTGRKLQQLVSKLGMTPAGFDVITDNPEDTDLMTAATATWFIENV